MVTQRDLGLGEGRAVRGPGTGTNERDAGPGVAPGPGRLARRAVKYGRGENPCKLSALPALRRAAGQAARSWPGQAAE